MNTRKSVAFCLLGLLFAAAASPVHAGSYRKDFFANQVMANAKIDGGAEVYTWAGKPKEHTIVVLANPLNPAMPLSAVTCKVCTDLTEPPGKAGPRPGLPIEGMLTRMPGDVSTVLPNTLNVAAYAGVANHLDSHKQHNFGTAEFQVFGREAGPKIIQVRKPGMAQPVPMNLFNFAQAYVQGGVAAGVIKDRDKCHGADSAAGTRIVGAVDNFKVVQHGDIPVVEATGRVFTGGASSSTPPGDPPRKAIEQGNLDPYFVSLVDLTTGAEYSEIVMRHTIEAVNGSWEIDDYGIRLVINRDDPTAFVDLMFDTPSSWVIDPYSYSARLDASGFTGAGELISGWTLNTFADTIEAFYPFGPGGMPYDNVAVAAPFGLFNPDHDYTYDIGAGDGAYERVLRAVPEPSSLGLLVITALSLAHCRRRWKH